MGQWHSVLGWLLLSRRTMTTCGFVLWYPHPSKIPQQPHSRGSTIGVVTSTYSNSDGFWGQERTKSEIQVHIQDSLERVGKLNTNHVVAENSFAVQVLSAEPPLVAIHNFVSDAQCETIVRLAQERTLQPSQVGAEPTIQSTRTSRTVWLKEAAAHDTAVVPDGTLILRTVAEKVSQISGLPTSHQENLQVVHYEPGQEFQLHTDHQDTFNDLERRGRLATCLIYLSIPEGGGETWFPNVHDLYIAPQRGTAVFFWNTVQRPGSFQYQPDMFLDTDNRMVHAGTVVTHGNKWICNKWIHPVDFGAGVRGL